MAIAKALGRAAKTAGKFLKEKGKQAVKVSRGAASKAKPTLAKAKDVTTKAGTRIKLGAKNAATSATNAALRVSESKAAQKTVAKTKEGMAKAKAKIAAKTPESVKKQFRSQEGTFGEKPNLRTRATALGKAAAGAAALPGNLIGAAAGPTIGKGVRAVKKKFGKKYLEGKEVTDMLDEFADAPQTQNFIRGVADIEKYGEIGGRISQGAAILGAGALTASIMTSNNNPKSDYEMKRSGDGFQLKFNDEGKNKILTGKSLSQKQVDEVRSIIAYMESIIVSDNPKARQKEFIAAMDQLSGYGVNSVVGKNLMINMPQSFANPRNW